MFNFRFLILLIAINYALPLKKDTKLGKKTPSLKQANCEKIKCPAVEQPICAKLLYRNAGNKTVYVVMVNKCEMNYVKCHEGLEAIVVPMKSCGHTDFIKSGSKRSKRDTTGDEQQDVEEDENAEIYPNNRGEVVFIEGPPPDYHTVDEPGIGDIEENSGSEYAPDKMPQYDLGDRDAERPEDINEGKRISEFYYEPNEKDDEENKYEEDEENTNQEDKDNTVREDEEDTNQEDKDNTVKEDEDHSNQEDEGSDLGSDYEFDKDDSRVEYHYDRNKLSTMKTFSVADGEVNLKQYYADCPTVCPSRDIMVCAKCQHGVFRTFLTTCHMRMFGCRHTDETLELIARLPCIMSSPFLSDASMQPTGRVQEPEDEDRVLRFIRCRELTQQSREENPRCKFANDQDTRLMVETYQVNDDY